MLNALSVLLHGGNREGYLRATRSMERQGFHAASQLAWAGGALGAWGHPAQLDVENCEVRTPSGVACCVGPVWYRGYFGNAALRSLLVDLSATGHIDEMALRGNFALFLRTQDHCLLMNDVLGFVRIYASSDGHFYSTSWLATCAYAGGVELNEAAAAEYVLLGASHSDRTVAEGITTLRLAHAFDLAQRRTQPRFPTGAWSDLQVIPSFDMAADQICDHLRTVSNEITAAFPGHTRMALSGGFDSRLILAGLLASGDRPELFVYGDFATEDTRIAREVAASVGLPLDVIDKKVRNGSEKRPDLDRLVCSGLFFDGLPNDGIYDLGADQQTRLEQNPGGCIGLNGGGGEIFRNFFHLPDRALHAIDIVRSFYRGFDPKVFRRPGGLGSYEGDLVTSIDRVLGIDNAAAHQTLGRKQVELLYPFFRCHHWMSVNNSVATRHGYYATPLVDLNAVRLAWQLPLAWKNAGKLESQLVARLHQGVARQSSAYGFRFSDGPDWRARLREWATRARPVSVRPFISATRRRLHRTGVAHDMLVHCRTVLPGEWKLDPILELERLPDNSALSRALAIEVAWRELVA
jgi:hypothetical protein